MLAVQALPSSRSADLAQAIESKAQRRRNADLGMRQGKAGRIGSLLSLTNGLVPAAGRFYRPRMRRRIALPVLMLAFAMLAVFGRSAGPVASAAPPSIGQAGGGPGAALWVTMTPIADDRQMLVVVDPNERTAAVYHVDSATGTMTLKSARSIRWDLLVGEFNAQEPTPSALRKLIESSPPPRP